MNVVEEKSCVNYPLCYLLIMKYIYANLIFASDLIFYLILLHLQAEYIQNLKKTKIQIFKIYSAINQKSNRTITDTYKHYKNITKDGS